MFKKKYLKVIDEMEYDLGKATIVNPEKPTWLDDNTLGYKKESTRISTKTINNKEYTLKQVEITKYNLSHKEIDYKVYTKLYINNKLKFTRNW